MKTFLFNIALFSSIGFTAFIALFIFYLVADPFKVLYSYNSLIESGKKGMVSLNQDFVSSTTFVNNSKHIRYDSFIFGNSRSMFYEISDWKTHLNTNANCFHFDASSEGLWALNKKVEFLNNRGLNIKNVLLILDYSALIQDKPNSGHLFTISPVLVNNENLIPFHVASFLAFLSPRFLTAYLDFKISGVVKPYMTKKYLLDNREKSYDITTNEMRFDFYENLIQKNEYYTKKRQSWFYDRDQTIQRGAPIAIHESQKAILTNIHNILMVHSTKVKIVISPLYDQVKLNDNDLDYLKRLFGKENVFDFSGINSYTLDYKNYYEASHYRPHVAKKIMETIYQREDLSKIQ
jgi:hypothetical protein